jgi:hypothetical protein
MPTNTNTRKTKQQAQEMTPGIGLKYRVINNKDVELGVRCVALHVV